MPWQTTDGISSVGLRIVPDPNQHRIECTPWNRGRDSVRGSELVEKEA